LWSNFDGYANAELVAFLQALSGVDAIQAILPAAVEEFQVPASAISEDHTDCHDGVVLLGVLEHSVGELYTYNDTTKLRQFFTSKRAVVALTELDKWDSSSLLLY
jgi:hypothetical protein